MRIFRLNHFFLAFASVLLLTVQASAKLSSSALEIERSKQAIDEIFRQTRLNEGESGWGDRYREEIDRFTKTFNLNYYSIFQDLGIGQAVARAAAYAKNESDAQRWIDQLNLFDRAVEGLTQKDKARYYFAMGLVMVQCSSDRLLNLPDDFFKAAENGYPSAFITDFISKDRSLPSDIDSTAVVGTLVQLARSYQSGGFYQEAYKFYLLALRSGTITPDLFQPMVECANYGGSDSLAFSTAQLFTEVFSAYGGTLPHGVRAINSISFGAGMAAENIWQECTRGNLIADLITNKPIMPPTDTDYSVLQNEVDIFESRFIGPIANSLGGRADQFLIALTSRYWDDGYLVKRFVLRIKGGIESKNAAIRPFVEKVVADPRFSTDADIAKWEARRWKESRKLKEYALQFPERFKLAGSPR